MDIAQRIQQRILQLSQLDNVLSLYLHQAESLLFHIWSFIPQEDVEALILKRRGSDCEVDEGDSRAQIGCELGIAVFCDHEHGEIWVEVDLLVAYSDQHHSSCLVDLLVKD